MCYTNGPRCSPDAKIILNQAIQDGDAAAIRDARKEYYTTPAGIKELRAAGKTELAERYAARRKRLIQRSKRLTAKDRAIRVALDLDNTTGSFNDGLRDDEVETFGYTPEEAAERYPDPPAYSFVDSKWFETKEAFMEAFMRAEKNGVYTKIKPYPDAPKTIRNLVASGKVEIHVVTARESKWNDETRAWLRRHRIPVHSITHTNDKASTDFDVYLDDADYQLKNLTAKDKKVIAFNQKYNTDINVPRVSSWTEVPAMIFKTVGKK